MKYSGLEAEIEREEEKYLGQLVDLCILLDVFYTVTNCVEVSPLYEKVWDEACKLTTPVEFHRMITEKMEQS